VNRPVPDSRAKIVRLTAVAAVVLVALAGGTAFAATTTQARSKAAVVGPSTVPSDFVGITPVRVLDTRYAIGVPSKAPMGPGVTDNVSVAGIQGIPTTATSVSANVTIDKDATARAYLTVWPAGLAKPNSSVNNATPGTISASAGVFGLGTNGELSVFNSVGKTNVIIDVTGYFVPAATTTGFNGGHWGVVHRNVIGNGDSQLAAQTVTPPLGQGALDIRTGSATDKAAFGNETDFVGMKVSSLSAIGYSVYTTAENNAVAAGNMPSISFEIDPNVVGSGNYASLVYAPDDSAPDVWTAIDAKNDTGQHWGLTGTFFNAQPDRCGLNGTRCTWDQVMTYLAANNDAAQGDATILTVQITKGRDYAFSGAVDALIIGGTTYDFEPTGVYATH
jgi:hypothetical protein